MTSRDASEEAVQEMDDHYRVALRSAWKRQLFADWRSFRSATTRQRSEVTRRTTAGDCALPGRLPRHPNSHWLCGTGQQNLHAMVVRHEYAFGIRLESKVGTSVFNFVFKESKKNHSALTSLVGIVPHSYSAAVVKLKISDIVQR